MKNSNNSPGIGFIGLLTLIFITLKLLGQITWSWWWVLSPVWIGIVLSLFLVALTFILANKYK